VTLECLPADPLDPYSLLASPALIAAVGQVSSRTERSDPAR
jgi:hypothetical protein